MRNKTRNSFTFYRNFTESAKVLNNEQRLQFYELIIEKSLDNKDFNPEEYDPLAVAMFNLVSPTLDKSFTGFLHGSKPKPSKGASKGSYQDPCRLDKDKDKDKDKDNKREKLLSVFSFDEFWEMYDKKADKKKAEARYAKFSEKIRAAIKVELPFYIAATPDSQFRKNPSTWLNGACWEDERKNPPIEEPDLEPDMDEVNDKCGYQGEPRQPEPEKKPTYLAAPKVNQGVSAPPEFKVMLEDMKQGMTS